MAQQLRFGIRLEGDVETQRALLTLRANVRNRVNRRSLDEAARTGVRLAKDKIFPRRTGLLKKSMAFKAKQSGLDKGYRVVGADRSYRTQVPGSRFQTSFPIGITVILTNKGKQGSKPRTAKIAARGFNVTAGLALDPAKYAHLVEGGRKPNRPTKKKAMWFRVSVGSGAIAKHVITKYVARVRAHAFMKPAADRLRHLIPGIVQRQLQRAA